MLKKTLCLITLAYGKEKNFSDLAERPHMADASLPERACKWALVSNCLYRRNSSYIISGFGAYKKSSTIEHDFLIIHTTNYIGGGERWHGLRRYALDPFVR
jgi:hypothetical protein